MDYKLTGPIEINRHPDDRAVIAQGIFESTDGSKRFMMTAHKLIDQPKAGFEYYTGENYLVGDNSRSYSRNFTNVLKVPYKYKHVAYKLAKALAKELNEKTINIL